MHLNKEIFLEKTGEKPMIPVFNHDDKDLVIEVLQACYRGGVRLFEFTDRSDRAIDVFKHLIKNQSAYPDMIIGVGTILDKNQAQTYFDEGASFIVSPIVDKGVADFCNQKQLAWVPGCGTLTELITAERYGARLLKVFPADVLGPKFIKGVLGPCRHLKLMPTGGVAPSKDNLKSWFDAGVTCVGMGSQLISKSIIETRDFESLSHLVEKIFIIIKTLKP